MAHFLPQDVRMRLTAAFSHGSSTKLDIPGYHKSAVLVPLIFDSDVVQLLLTKRTDLVETHKGQIAFPGGMVDEGDLDIVHTALRETEEELGISAAGIETVGILDDMFTPSGFIISPVVGVLRGQPSLRINRMEVAETFQVPFGFFAESGSGRFEMREVLGRKREVWFYEYGTHVIWGATAMIIRELLKKIGLLN